MFHYSKNAGQTQYINDENPAKDRKEKGSGRFYGRNRTDQRNHGSLQSKRSGTFFPGGTVYRQPDFSDWELILYDDGSKEPYRQTIRQAADMDKRIVLIRGEKNRGLAYGLNQCLRRAVGRYIARMDDDDVAREDRLEKQLRFLELHPGYQWVGSNVELIDRRGVWGCRKVPAVPGKRDFLFTSPYIHPTVLFHKRVLQENGGYNTAKEYLLCEDYELFMRLHKRGYQGYNIQDTLLQYTEDYKAHKKRTYRRRIREMKMRYQGFRRLGILNGGTFHHVLRPLLAGAIPAGPRHYIKSG